MAAVLLIVGLICFVYYIFVSSYVGFSIGIYTMWLLLAFFSWINAWFFHKKIWGRLPSVLVKLYAAALVILFLCFAVPECLILSGMNAQPEADTEYIIVLGAQVKGTAITRSLRYRLDAALEYYQNENKDVKFVLSGGQGEGEAISEAEAMKLYLTEHGVPEEQLLLEERSSTTQENLAFSYTLIEEDLKRESAGRKVSDVPVAVCSNNFHVFRAVKLAKAQGFAQASGLSGASDIRILPMMLVREAAAVIKEFFCGNF